MAVISVFGSSNPRPGSADYELARQMGHLLAESGFTVQTGGYGGVMEAASLGAVEAGGATIGVTCTQIESFRPMPPNQWVQTEIKHETLRQRLAYLVESNDGIIVMPGGVGTLTELSLSWSLVQVGEIPPRPIVAVGGLWARTISAFLSPEYVPPKYATLVQLAKTPKDAIKFLQTTPAKP